VLQGVRVGLSRPVEIGLPLDRCAERDVYGDCGQAATPRTLVDPPIGGHGRFSDG